MNTILTEFNATEITKLIGKARNTNSYPVEDSLVYITDKVKFKAGAVYVTDNCAISAAFPLQEYVRRRIDNLFVGIGAYNFDADDDEKHHPIKYVDSYYSIAIVIVSSEKI